MEIENRKTHITWWDSNSGPSDCKSKSVEGRGYRRADDKLHEAGFDAYVTGLCFLAMHQHLARMRGDQPQRLPDPDCAALKPFLNKLFLAKTAYQDSPYINLTGADPTPSRDHVFYLTFPKEWQRNDINDLFSTYGPVTVQFLDETSALVALTRRDQIHSIRDFFEHTHISLTPFALYKAHGPRVRICCFFLLIEIKKCETSVLLDTMFYIYAKF
ncbi:Poly(A)-specific ribonuclease PARN [Papilio machaon]|uniref:Poly(A)-specific ribonuclease PARN n=1 Tax=Papilio machaon TaxID=76193 RepID=A0A0N1ICM7_PAPMA|nr:Poly(A)-specific ribonuclease PARN [Papilio machaon]